MPVSGIRRSLRRVEFVRFFVSPVFVEIDCRGSEPTDFQQAGLMGSGPDARSFFQLSIGFWRNEVRIQDMSEGELRAHLTHQMDFIKKHELDDVIGSMLVIFMDNGITQYVSSVAPNCAPDSLRELADRLEERASPDPEVRQLMQERRSNQELEKQANANADKEYDTLAHIAMHGLPMSADQAAERCRAIAEMACAMVAAQVRMRSAKRTMDRIIENDEPAYGRICQHDGCSNVCHPDWPYAWCEACQNEKCHHGNPPHECNDCDRESDSKFDERRN